ncbi:MAG: Gldg family protein [Verrucomicrobium sp.]|nr:Gldg family protein [Verrucomicrobium sp.]
MNSKTSTNTLILLLVVAIVIVVNFMVGGLGFLNFRLDLTEKGVFTLSKGTKQIIENLNADEPVSIKFYATGDSRLMPQGLQTYGNTVRDLLVEVQKSSKGKITLENIDPRPNTEEEDKAVADDIQGHTVNEEGDKAYFGIAIHALGKKEVIPFVTPADENTLEYQIARSLAQVTRTKKTVVGVMSPIPLAGPAFNFPPMMQQPNQRPPWLVIKQLRLDYDVREVPMSAESVDSDINILLVIHPSEITPRAEFAIDQFLLKGGKVIAFVDPQSLVSRAYNNPGQMGRAPSTFVSPNSDLPTLFKEWGVGYDKNLVVADMVYRMNNQRRAVPIFLGIGPEGINMDEPVTAPLQEIQMFSAGAFTINAKPGINATTLISSSEVSQLIDGTDAEKAMREDLRNFQSSGKKQIMGVRLSGRFKTAFAEGQPKATAPAPESPALPGGLPPGFNPSMFQGGGTGGENDKPAGAPVDAAKEAPKPEALKESANGEGVVFLFSDVDMEYDEFCVRQDQMGGMQVSNSNIPLLLNTVEMLSGGADLIAVRSRASANRPFTKLQELNAAVESQFQPRLEKLAQERNDVVQEIAKAGGAKSVQGLVILDPNREQMKQLQDKQVEILKKERELKKELNRTKDRREFWITVWNLLGIPLLIVAIGLSVAMRRRSLQAAH